MTAATPNLTLVAVIVVLTAGGVYLLLERSLTRIVLGLVLLGNAVNLLLLVAGGAAGRPPVVTDPAASTQGMADPLAQAMVLTAIVITLGLTAFLLAMSYRSWQLHRHDEVADDVEDRRIARLAARDRPVVRGADADDGVDLDSQARQARDETDEGPDGPSTAPPGQVP